VSVMVGFMPMRYAAPVAAVLEKRDSVGPARGVLHRLPRELEGRVEHDRVAPPAELSPFVAHFWSVRWRLDGLPPVKVETLPHPTVHLTFEAGRARVGGVHSRRFSRTLEGDSGVFGIKFRPATFRAVLGAPLSTLTNRAVPLRRIFGAAGDALARQLHGEPKLRRRIALACAFLRAQLPALPARLVTLRDLVERLATDVELTRVEQVAALLDVDRRTLERRFRDAIGVSPKWVIRRYRLHEAAAQLEQPGVTLAELALRLGYFDQAHFTRDFTAAVGRPPTVHRARAPSPPAGRGSG
jgi:AraC-like DNA-binding protein